MSERHCIIGAGASGLAVAKIFVQRGIPFDLLERESQIGGLWNINTPSGIVYESTHLVSAIATTSFRDFVVASDGPRAGPDYPSHDWVMDYFHRYAAAFGISPHLQTGTKVERVTPVGDGTWWVKIAGESDARRYAGVVIANGHHDRPRRPDYPGTFRGEIIHSRDYKSQRQLRDKRVLVVGAGNSGCDIVKDAAHVSGSTVLLSMRRGTWFVPKFVLGFPTGDVLANIEWALTPVPRVIKAWLLQASLWVLQGPPSRYKLPDPDHRIDHAHPTMSDDVPRLVAHGRVLVRPAIERFDENDVVFTGGQRDTVDMVVLATGYELSIPFLDPSLYLGADGKPALYLNTLSPAHGGLFFAGLIQANGSIWRLAALQGQLIANAIIADQSSPDEARALRERALRKVGAVSREKFVASNRHKLEANYFDYARTLKKAARMLRRAGRMQFVSADAPIMLPIEQRREAAE
jgi:Flavin-binding monooxygenase-like